MGFQEEEEEAFAKEALSACSSAHPALAELCALAEGRDDSTEQTSCFPQVPTDNGLMQKSAVCVHMHASIYT